ncbi:MAG TPA: cadherin-like domain-containing protein, partial [Pirellulales bacterium]|nr:cadherin-like domain-containing protein [Pirellulales bacterium]
MLSLTVFPQNFSTPQNTPLTISQGQLLAGDADGNVVLRASNVTQPAHDAALVANPDGTFTFTPGSNFKGSTSFSYTVSAAEPQTEVTAPDGVSNGGFGRSVAIDGDTAVIGAAYQTVNGVHQGAAYVFVRSDKGWVEQAELSAPDGGYLEHF